MKIMTEKEFWAYHENNPGRFPDVAYAVNKAYRSASARRKRYFQYVSRMEEKENQLQLKMAEKPDEQAVSFREAVLKRDGNRCQLCKSLNTEEMRTLMSNAGILWKVLDVAHIKSRGSSPDKKWDLNNVVLLNRYSHSMLDQGKHPLRGTSISPAEKAEWWKRIIDASVLAEKKEVSMNGQSVEEAGSST